ncbi:fructose-bisphosphate aldolase [Bradyrhizobium sp. LMG 8443]|nr:fructose-bisphosphate aldolase [Bradyrhizobium sp. LMG 8443]
MDMSDLLRHAHCERYAIGAYDVVDTAFLEAVLDGAEGCRAPVIASLAESHFDHFDFECLMPVVVDAARRARVPVAIHLDHGHSLATVERAIRLGCNNVMVDASLSSLEDNIKATREVVRLARRCGVRVEGELGYVPGVEGEDAEKHPRAMQLTSLADAERYIAETPVDCLAISIGTVHGRLRVAPRLDFERLSALSSALHIPLVIHGGTGLSDDQYGMLAANGVAKINYFTGLADAAARSIVEEAESKDSPADTALIHGVRGAVRAEVERTCRLFGAAGRAGAASAACRRWREVEHVVVYNLRDGGQNVDWSAFAAQGVEALGAIPGVRNVLAGRALRTDAPYLLCWLIRFASPEVVASYRDHPDHVGYADKVFRPTAPDRVTIDFELVDVSGEEKKSSLSTQPPTSSGTKR